MNARAVVDKLLEAEAEDDFSQEWMKNYALSARDYFIQNQPEAVADVLQHAPDDFVQAFIDGSEAKWELGILEANWWPAYDDDYDTYTKYSYDKQQKKFCTRLLFAPMQTVMSIITARPPLELLNGWS